MSRLRLAVFAASALWMSSCMIGPNHSTPKMDLPEKWSDAGNSVYEGAAESRAEWWANFNDPMLVELIEKACQENYELQSLAMRIVWSRANLKFDKTQLLPAVFFSGSALHIEQSTNKSPDVGVDLPTITFNLPGQGGGPGQVVSVSGKPQVHISNQLDLYSGGFDAFWEMDFWGKARRGIQASNHEQFKFLANYDDYLVTLAGEVAFAYIGARTTQRYLALLKEQEDLVKRLIAAAEKRGQGGHSTAVDMPLLQSRLKLIQANRIELESRLERYINSICILVGRMPNDPEIKARMDSGNIPETPMHVAMDIPANLLRRRPDIRAQEQKAAAQCARIGATKALLYPSFRLLGSLGLVASSTGNFFDSDSVESVYGGAFSWNIFSAPALIQWVRQRDARYEEFLFDYKQTVLHAAQEVENASSGFLAAKQKLPLAAEREAIALTALDAAVRQYSAGSLGLALTLHAMNEYFDAQNGMAASKGEAATRLVALYKAFGGGWQVRVGKELLKDETKERMRERSGWKWFGGTKEMTTSEIGLQP